MTDPQPPLNETPARREALQEVVVGLISYNPLLGQYLKGGQAITGSRRRTFAELREHKYIKPGSTTKIAKMLLTDPKGEDLAVEWGLKNPPAEAAQTAE